jgi:hypothetical protein
MKLAHNIFTLRKVEVLRKENMEEENFSPLEGEELEEAKLDGMPMENQGTSLGNVSR